jgi:hypothetical protein
MEVLNVIRDLIVDKNVSVILVHHMGKPSVGRVKSIGVRGSSAIQGEYDSYISIDKGKEGQELTFDFRHSETPDPRFLKFNADTFWFETENGTSKEDPIRQILKEHDGKLAKKLLVDLLVSGGRCKDKKTASNKINWGVKNGKLKEDKKVISLP